VATDANALQELRIQRKAAPKRKGGRAGFWLIAGAIVLVVAGAVTLLARKPVPVVATEQATEVPTGAQAVLLNGSGYVTARRQATVSSKVTGKVVEVLVEEGFRVEEGQVLARLDASNIETNLKLAEAQLESAKLMLAETRASLVQAQREFERVTQLKKNGIASPSDFDKAESDARTLEARLERQTADIAVADRQVAVWRQQVEDNVIRAPFAGVVTSKNAQPGEMISPISAGGGFTRTGICTLVDMGSLEIEVDVNESYINRVTAKQPVEATLDAYPDWRIPAKVIAIIPTADRQKSTVKVRVGFDKLDPRILPDMGVKVAFQGASDAGAKTASASLVSVPKRALRQDGGRDVVWVVQGGRLERRAVTVDGARGESAVLSAGVHLGDKVVVEGPEGLVDGGLVKEKKP
jgi:HlyD family secretion protein